MHEVCVAANVTVPKIEDFVGLVCQYFPREAKVLDILVPEK